MSLINCKSEKGMVMKNEITVKYLTIKDHNSSL